MREVDTNVLKDVARSLGIGNPATARGQVVFDDDNLQQVWDATKFGQIPQLDAQLDLDVNAGGPGSTGRQSLTFADLFGQSLSYYDRLVDQGLEEPGETDVWLLGVTMQILTADAANFTNMGVAFVPWSMSDTNEGNVLLAFGSGAITTTAIDLIGLYQIIGSVAGLGYQRFRLPSKVYNRRDASDVGALKVFINSNGGGDVNGVASWFLHYQPRGTPLWYQTG